MMMTTRPLPSSSLLTSRATSATTATATATATIQLTIGQDLDSIRQYIDTFDSNSNSNSSSSSSGGEGEGGEKQCPPGSSSSSTSFMIPKDEIDDENNNDGPQGSSSTLLMSLTGVMFYTDIQTLKGMTTDSVVDYGSGIEDLQSLKQLLLRTRHQHQQQQQQQQQQQHHLPPYNIQIGLWLNGTQGCRDIILSGSSSGDQKTNSNCTTNNCTTTSIITEVSEDDDTNTAPAGATTTTPASNTSGLVNVRDNIRKMFEILLDDDDDDGNCSSHDYGSGCNDDDDTDKARFHYYLRVGYEFDNPSFGYDDPTLYVKAFQKIVTTCHELYGVERCQSKISFVWHSWAAPRTFPLEQFYPGDDYVDWIGVSIFQQVYPWANTNNNNNSSSSSTSSSNNTNSTEFDSQYVFAGGTLQQVHEVLDFADLHKKPVMIAESTPFGGIHGEDFDQVFGRVPSYQRYKSSLVRPVVKPPASSNEVPVFDTWTLWFEPVLKLINEYDSIRMWSYINCNWDAQPMWKDIGFGDTRLSSSPAIRQKWISHVLCNSRFSTITTGTYTSAATATPEKTNPHGLEDVDPNLDLSSSADVVTTISAQSVFKDSMISSKTRVRLRYGGENNNHDYNNDSPATQAVVLDESFPGSATVQEMFSATTGLPFTFLLFLISILIVVVVKNSNNQRRRWYRELRFQSGDNSSLPIQETRDVASYGSLD